MDAEDFKTLGECEFGTIWEVQSENRVVVNAYQAAMYFSKEQFLQFAKMIENAVETLTGKRFSSPSPSIQASQPSIQDSSQISDLMAFRKSRSKKPSDDDHDDFIS